MSTDRRLTEVFESAEEIPFDDTSKFILFSDCHRGDNSWADDFAHNQQLFFHALEHYYANGFTYIEVGDGDELWENKQFENIRRAHSDSFWLMRKFYTDDRLYLIYGNHDIERRNPNRVKETLFRYYDDRTAEIQPLFENIKVHEGLILRHSGTGDGVFMLHGHQTDPISDRWWRFSRFVVRHFWRHLQILGVKDPTSPAQNYKKRSEVEQRLINWSMTRRHVFIAGHTHRPRFPEKGDAPYFNTGCCVHPRCITGIEIESGKIALIKWSIKPNESGVLFVGKDVLEGPEELSVFFNSG
jgi:predicted phosphodiesterase